MNILILNSLTSKMSSKFAAVLSICCLLLATQIHAQSPILNIAPPGSASIINKGPEKIKSQQVDQVNKNSNGCPSFTINGPFGDPCTDSKNGSALACSGGTNSIFQAIDVSGLTEPTEVVSIDFDQESFGGAPNITLRLYCASAGGAVPYAPVNVPFFTEVFSTNKSNDGSCVTLTFTTPPVVDASCESMWVEFRTTNGKRVVASPKVNNGATATGNVSYIRSPNCSVTSPKKFKNTGFTLDAVIAANFDCICTLTDEDGDGITECDGDCDDFDNTVYPGAPEICDGIDNNCNGEIDEITTFVGNVVLTTQAEVDAFITCYSVIDGNLTISGTGVTDLSNLSNLEEITGNLEIQSAGLSNLAGLDNLTAVGGSATFFYNPFLTSLDGLDALGSVGSNLVIYYNFSLSDGCAIYNLVNGGVNGMSIIYFNAYGCNSVTEINANCAGSSLLANPNTFQTQAQAMNGLNSKDVQAANQLSVFPNPAAARTSIQFDEAVNTGQVKVINLSGSVVFKQPLTPGTLQFDLDVSGWENGSYLIQVLADEQLPITKRFIVLR